MTPLTLTKEQRERLLEMAKKLFPEYIDVRYGKNWDRDEIWFNNYAQGELYRDDKEQDAPMFHWYEFCMTELVEKILNPIPEAPNRNLQEEFKNFFWKSNSYWEITKNNRKIDKIHPIDYLYEEFLKLKLN